MIMKRKKTMKNKNVLIGLTGSIAAYKTCEMVSLFKKSGANVKVVMTDSASLFVGEKTFETLTGNPVYIDMFQKKMETGHISLADWADIFIIAPISANTISKIAQGVADNLLTSLACAYLGKNKPFFVAPAMNEGMWKNPFVSQNIEKLKTAGVYVVEPVVGNLACGYTGIGKMENVSVIFDFVKSKLRTSNGKKVLITSGGTKEYIDPVRFISNDSSGKMGNALADCAYEMGYDVVLISTYEINKPYSVIVRKTAEDMQKAVFEEFKNSNYLIMASAVSDFKVEMKKSKIRKSDIKNGSYNIELQLNPDILKSVGQIKKEGQRVIGFSLSTEDTLEIGAQKLKDKNCDFIIANEAKTSLNSDNAEVWVIDKNGVKKLEYQNKKDIARAILEIVL